MLLYRSQINNWLINKLFIKYLR